MTENFRGKSAVERGTAEAAVSIGGTMYNLPVRKGTLGPDVVDISTLYPETGCFTYDPGFTSTASCESKDHVHRLRQRDSALSRLSDRATRRAQHLY